MKNALMLKFTKIQSVTILLFNQNLSTHFQMHPFKTKRNHIVMYYVNDCQKTNFVSKKRYALHVMKMNAYLFIQTNYDLLVK